MLRLDCLAVIFQKIYLSMLFQNQNTSTPKIFRKNTPSQNPPKPKPQKMLTSRPQLRYTSLADMCSVTCAPHELVQCVCCLRYLSRVDGGTILLSPKEYNVRGIVHAGRDAIPCIYIHQAGILQKPRHYACFICEPHMRRAQRDHSAGNLATVASSFVQDALDCVLHGRMARMDFFCVLKGCICLAAHVQSHDRRHYHPLRSASRDVLEGVIALMHFLTESVPRVSDQPTSQVVWDDVAAVQEEHATLRGLPPIEEIIALARACHLGDLSFPLVVQHDSQDALVCASLLRRAVRSVVFAPALALYHARVSEVSTSVFVWSRQCFFEKLPC